MTQFSEIDMLETLIMRGQEAATSILGGDKGAIQSMRALIARGLVVERLNGRLHVTENGMRLFEKAARMKIANLYSVIRSDQTISIRALTLLGLSTGLSALSDHYDDRNERVATIRIRKTGRTYINEYCRGKRGYVAACDLERRSAVKNQ